MDSSEIPFLSAAELARLIETREVSPVQATEAYLQRIAEVDGQAELVHHRSPASKRWKRLGRPKRRLPPATTAARSTGCRWRSRTSSTPPAYAPRAAHPSSTSTCRMRTPRLWRKLKDAGAVLLGKLNMSEFAMADIFNHPHGTPRNPWDTTRNPGTSSSGSGAATAAFLCATSLGEDTGGSIRSPANFSGLVGLRPTYGRVSRHGVMGGSWSMDTVGPISRTVEDAAITFQAIAGHDANDPYTLEVPVPDYRAALTGDISGLRVGVVAERVDAPNLDPEMRSGSRRRHREAGRTGSRNPRCIHSPGALGCGGVEHDHHRRGMVQPAPPDVRGRTSTNWTGTTRYGFSRAWSSRPRPTTEGPEAAGDAAGSRCMSALEDVDVLALPSGVGPAPPVESVPGVPSKEMAHGRPVRPHQLHRAVQPGQCPSDFRALRIHRVRAAPGVADRRQDPSPKRRYSARPTPTSSPPPGTHAALRYNKTPFSSLSLRERVSACPGESRG